MSVLLSSPSRSQTERVIAAARVALAVAGLFAIWADPTEPARFATLTYGLHAAYLLYSLVLGALVWGRRSGAAPPLITHAIDIVLFAVFQYLTTGPSSPFFVYFIFSLFCGAMRWGWRGTLATAGVVMAAFLGTAMSMNLMIGAVDFEVNRFIIRDCVRRVYRGEQWIDREAVTDAFNRVAGRAADAREAGKALTPRELEIVRLIAQGLRNRVVAERLSISEGTVKIHLHNIYEKLGVDGRLELVLLAQSKGLV